MGGLGPLGLQPDLYPMGVSKGAHEDLVLGAQGLQDAQHQHRQRIAHRYLDLGQPVAHAEPRHQLPQLG